MTLRCGIRTRAAHPLRMACDNWASGCAFWIDSAGRSPVTTIPAAYPQEHTL
jgi:hypothetical protein